MNFNEFHAIAIWFSQARSKPFWAEKPIVPLY